MNEVNEDLVAQATFMDPHQETFTFVSPVDDIGAILDDQFDRTQELYSAADENLFITDVLITDITPAVFTDEGYLANYGTVESFTLPSPFKTLQEELGHE